MESSRKSLFYPFITLLIILGMSSGCSTIRDPKPPDPLTAEDRIKLGLAYEKEGKLELALGEFRKAQRGSYKAASLTYQGNLFLHQSELSKAEQAYRKALQNDPDHLMALNNLAWLLALRGKDLEEAEKLIDHALSLDPEFPEPYQETLNEVLRVQNNPKNLEKK